jgi:branched-subunit amino acid aminotransferase/4-amino-4-deoxychorismate lyase
VLVWLNGRIVPAHRARVSALDRGLLHGDGLYDTWRLYDGVPFATAAHLQRLSRAARRLELPAPGAAAMWDQRVRRLAARNGLADAAVRLTLTRGTAGDAVLPTRSGKPTLLLTTRPLPTDLARRQQRGIRATLLPFPRDGAPPWGGLKLVGHASAVAGRMLAARRHADEGLYVSADGRVAEGTTSNLFAVRRGTLITPPAAGDILGGVTRDLVLRLARRSGVRVREAQLMAATLAQADEILVTASTVEVLPVVRLDTAAIGDGRPGPVTRELQRLYRTHVARVCARVRPSR